MTETNIDAICPHCGHKWQPASDYYDAFEDEIECCRCGDIYYITAHMVAPVWSVEKSKRCCRCQKETGTNRDYCSDCWEYVRSYSKNT